MTRSHAIVGVLAAACAGAPPRDSAAPVDAWWEIDGDPLTETAEDRKEEFEAELSGGLYADGERWGGHGGVKARQDGDMLCDLAFDLPQTGEATGCDACELQLAVTPTDLQHNESGRCEEVGIDPSALTTQPLVLGFSGETLWMQGPDGWSTVGTAWREGGGWLFRVLLSPEAAARPAAG